MLDVLGIYPLRLFDEVFQMSRLTFLKMLMKIPRASGTAFASLLRRLGQLGNLDIH
jgi:hypothetical protein